MPSSTSSSSSRRTFVVDVLVFVFGIYASLTLVWIVDRLGVWAVLEIDPRVATKWQPPTPTQDWAIFATRPRTPSGRYFRRRRAGKWTGNTLAVGPEIKGFFHHPYRAVPPVKTSYGRYGFRDELPAEAGGVAVLGSSYVEAGFANAEDTIPGWLRRDHSLSASNFGLAYFGGSGETVLHYLERYVLPTKPGSVVWVVAERAAFSQTMKEVARIRDYRVARPQLSPSLGFHLYDSSKGFVKSALQRALLCRDRWGEAVGLGVAERPDLGWSLDGLTRAEAEAVVAYYRKVHPQTPLRTLSLAGKHHPIDMNAPPPRELMSEATPVLRGILERLEALCEASGVKLALVFIPSRTTLFAGFEGLTPPVAPEEAGESYEVLAKLCADLGIPIRDTTPALRQALEQGQLLHNPIVDHHLNTRGMRVVAAEIAASLR